MKIVEYTPSKYVTLNLVHQIDHNNAVVKFDGIIQSDENNVVYFILGTDKKSFKVPLKDMSFKVTSPMTDISGMLKGQIREYAPDGSFIDNLTDIFPVLIRDSIDGDIIEITDPRIDLWFDAMQKLYNEVKDEYESGALDGKDGVGIKSIEKTKSEGLTDTYTITLTDDSTFVYSVTNGRNGIDGRSAYEIAVQNGFKGTEQEWLESLRYDHSDEFKQLADQVKLDAKSAEDSATKAESAMNEANTIAQANVEAINKASTNAVQAVKDAQSTAEEAIGDKQIEAVQAVDTAKTSATQAITEQKESAVSTITQEKTSATEAIETGKTEALTEIEIARDNAIEEIENTGVPLEDIEKLAIKENAEGNPTIISGSADWRLQKLSIYGQSEQDSTTGKNLLNPIGATKSGWNIALPNFKLEIGKTYTYTAPSTLTGSKSAGLYAAASDTQLATYLTVGKTATFTVPENADMSQGILLAGGSADSLVLGDELTAMVELGSVATEFEPYTGGKPSPSLDYPQEIISKEVSEIKVTGNNLFDFVTLAGGEGATFEKNGLSARIENGYLITTGTAINDDFTNILFVSVPKDKRTVFPAGTYRLGKGDKGMTNLTIGITTVSGKQLCNYGVTFTIDEPFYFTWFYIAYALGQNANGEKVPLAMAFGSENLYEYESYQEQSIKISEPITLYGVPVSNGGNITFEGNQYIADILKEKDGVIGIDRNIELLTMTGANSESWIYNLTIGTIQKEPCFVMSNASKYKSGQLGYCERYIEHSLPITNGQCHMRSAYAGEGRISICDSTFSSLEEWKQHLSENPLKATFLLKEPIFEPLPDEVQAQYKALKSYYPNTVIQTGCWNEVEYVADTKTWIENKLSGVTELALGIGGK